MLKPLFNVAALLTVAPAPFGESPIPAAAQDAAALLANDQAVEAANRGLGIAVSNLTGDGIRIDWEVEKHWGSTPDTAKVSVFNLSLINRTLLSTMKAQPIPLRVTLSAGWGGLPEVLFKGKATKVIPSEHRGGVDVVSTLEAGDGLLELRDTPPAGGSVAGAPMIILVQGAIEQLRLADPSPITLGIIAEAAAKVPLAQAFSATFDQSPRDQLDHLLSSIGLAWGIADEQFVVYRYGVRDDVLPSILTPATGLLGWAETGDGGVEFTGLAQSRVVPGMQIQVLDFEGIMVGGAPLRVEKINFAGSTNGESTMTGTARKLAPLGVA